MTADAATLKPPVSEDDRAAGPANAPITLVEYGDFQWSVLRDLAGDAFEETVRAHFTSGVRSGVNGTPTCFVNGVGYEGDWSSVSAFAADLERAIA